MPRPGRQPQNRHRGEEEKIIGKNKALQAAQTDSSDCPKKPVPCRAAEAFCKCCTK